MIRKVKKAFSQHPSTTVQAVATKMKLPRATVSTITIRNLGINARVKKNAPEYTERQQEHAKFGLRKIRRKMRRKVIIPEDETYVPVDPKNVAGWQFYNRVNPAQVIYDEKLSVNVKFFSKFTILHTTNNTGSYD